MSARVVNASAESSFKALDVIIVVLRVFAWLNVAGIFLCLIGTLIASSGPVNAANSAATMVWGVGIFACLGSALFCFTTEQALLLARRAVAALETLIGTSPTPTGQTTSGSSKSRGLPPPP